MSLDQLYRSCQTQSTAATAAQPGVSWQHRRSPAKFTDTYGRSLHGGSLPKDMPLLSVADDAVSALLSWQSH